jgi:hypothetical protein
VARDGAELLVSCPDMEKICRLYLEDGGRSLLADRQARFVYDLDGLPAQHIVNDLFHQDGDHKNLYDFEMLAWALERSGFGACRQVSEHDLLQRFPGFPARLDDAVSLYVTARAVSPLPPADTTVPAPHWGGARFQRTGGRVTT